METIANETDRDVFNQPDMGVENKILNQNDFEI